MNCAQASEIPDDLVLAARAALAGGAAVRRHYGRGSLEVSEKAPGDPVTEADHASERAILALLSRERPGEAVLSEESEPPGPAALGGRLWVVDPLDGTREFIEGIGEFAVMVGLAEGGRARLGAVYRPDPGLLWLGLTGGGAWQARVEARDPTPPSRLPELEPLAVPGRREGPVRLIHSRSHTPAGLERLRGAVGERGLERIPCGSVGVKCGAIARGRADLYVHPVPYLKEWDTCAPEAVLRGAGGRVTDCRGERLSYGKAAPAQPGGLLAATPAVWTRVLPTVTSMAPSDGGDPPHGRPAIHEQPRDDA